jgi:excisionase family DNA binding protein
MRNHSNGKGAMAAQNEDLENFYTMSDVAKKLNMSRQTLYNHMHAGRIKPRRVGRYSVLSEAEVEKFRKRLKVVHVDGQKRLILGG